MATAGSISVSVTPVSVSSKSSSGFVRGALCGGSAAMTASLMTHPIELFKVRMQLAGELDKQHKPNAIRTLRTMFASEGLLGFYRGLSASMVRQTLYGPARFGIYQTLTKDRTLVKPFMAETAPLPPASGVERLCCSLLAGGMSGVLSSPADLVMVRMQADGRLAQSAQRRYNGVFGGFMAVIRESGVRGLWRGCGPNVQRAMITTGTQFTSYDQLKPLCAKWFHLSDGLPLHASASLLSSLVVATCASPTDVIRTRMMNSKKLTAAAAPLAATETKHDINPSKLRSTTPAVPLPSSTPASSAPLVAYARAYTSTLDCIVQTFRSEGVRGFYKGFIPYYCRVAPQVTFMFIFFEQFQTIYDRHIGV